MTVFFPFRDVALKEMDAMSALLKQAESEEVERIKQTKPRIDPKPEQRPVSTDDEEESNADRPAARRKKKTAFARRRAALGRISIFADNPQVWPGYEKSRKDADEETMELTAEEIARALKRNDTKQRGVIRVVYFRIELLQLMLRAEKLKESWLVDNCSLVKHGDALKNAGAHLLAA